MSSARATALPDSSTIPRRTIYAQIGGRREIIKFRYTEPDAVASPHPLATSPFRRGGTKGRRLYAGAVEKAARNGRAGSRFSAGPQHGWCWARSRAGEARGAAGAGEGARGAASGGSGGHTTRHQAPERGPACVAEEDSAVFARRGSGGGKAERGARQSVPVAARQCHASGVAHRCAGDVGEGHRPEGPVCEPRDVTEGTRRSHSSGERVRADVGGIAGGPARARRRERRSRSHRS